MTFPGNYRCEFEVFATWQDHLKYHFLAGRGWFKYVPNWFRTWLSFHLIVRYHKEVRRMELL